ncbi:hypothetical protein PMKS-000082 [Pichia membranifaciens]|uniref:Uncharacterized protein n=1 Tax=Pichia membranifaciens TaxID=4926 RepID=A0A1Q2YAY2_9ASCO|nr:hypothetical protein PMKS-000082 [Pichia membranifaciens]
MATEVIRQPPIQYFNKDTRSSSSNYSVYTSDAHHRITNGDFIFQANAIPKNPGKRRSLTKLTESELKEQPLSNRKSPGHGGFRKANFKKEFTVVRKNSYKKPNYFRLSHSASSPKSLKKAAKFQNSKQIEPAFDMYPSKSILENPSYMVQYFTTTLNLIKKDPAIHYKILKAHIDTKDNANNEAELIKRTKKKKYTSLPVMGSSKPLKEELNELRYNKRNSAPAVLSYEPTDMTMAEYLNTPLDFYKHRKKVSEATTTGDSKETKLSSKGQTSSSRTHPGSENKGGSSGSGADSVSTSALYARRSKLTYNPEGTSSSQRSYPLKTAKKNSILKRSSALPYDTASENASFHLQRELSSLKKEEYLSKYGTELLENAAGKAIIEEENPNRKRISDCGDLSIATGNELYNEVKNEIAAKRLLDWDSAYSYIAKKDPDLAENYFFLIRYMLELYLRRVLSAKIALKLGTDKSNKGEGNEVWIGLKECIASVYGEDNALFFESHNARKM